MIYPALIQNLPRIIYPFNLDNRCPTLSRFYLNLATGLRRASSTLTSYVSETKENACWLRQGVRYCIFKVKSHQFDLPRPKCLTRKPIANPSQIYGDICVACLRRWLLFSLTVLRHTGCGRPHLGIFLIGIF